MAYRENRYRVDLSLMPAGHVGSVVRIATDRAVYVTEPRVTEVLALLDAFERADLLNHEYDPLCEHCESCREHPAAERPCCSTCRREQCKKWAVTVAAGGR